MIGYENFIFKSYFLIHTLHNTYMCKKKVCLKLSLTLFIEEKDFFFLFKLDCLY